MADDRQKVYLVGAGPGSPELITVRGAELLKCADVVVYDHLVNEELLNLVPRSAEFIYAGKKGGGERAIDQDALNQTLIDCARAGKRTVRLKGGDPFIFGRGGEECAALEAAGIEFEVVPGVTSAIAVPAYAGIPLTHRDFGSFVAFVTGHEDEAKTPEAAVPWHYLAQAARNRGTLVLLMAVGRLREITGRLMEAGLPATTPAAAIQHGTSAAQRTTTGVLSDLAEKVERERIGSPSVIVIGECAGLRGQLEWFEKRPLFGRRVVITRRPAASVEFAQMLRNEGAEVIQFPTIETAPPDTYSHLDNAIAQLRSFDWIVFTSAEGVDRFLARLRELGHDIRELAGISLAAIGPATAARVEINGMRVAALPKEYRAEAIIDALGADEIRGKRFLIPRAQVARQVLPEMLIEQGAFQVEAVPAYKTVLPGDAGVQRLRVQLGSVDLIAFTSSSTVSNFCKLIGRPPEGLRAAAIGPITAETAREFGFNVVVSPAEYTVKSLAIAIRDYLAARH